MSTKLVRYAIFSLIAFAFLLIPVLSTPKVEATSNLAVTPAGYDDIGSVLTKLGYSATEIEVSDLTDYEKIKNFDAIYINCSGELDALADGMASPLKQYVNEGGIIYASDFANAVMQKAFPDKIQFYKSNLDVGTDEINSARVGQSGTQTATVVDPGLASILGKNSVEINFDLASWAIIDKVTSDVRIHMRGPAPTFDYSMDGSATTLENKPYTVSFHYGQGEVLYTSFHNEAQVSEDVAKIINWFGVRTRAGKIARETRDLIEKDNDKILFEIIDSINKDETKSYKFNATGEKGFKTTLNFPGSEIKIVILAPNGEEVDSSSVSKPPYSFDLSKADAGYYTFNITAVDIPTDNYPFVVEVSGDEAAAVDKIDYGTDIIGDESSNVEDTTTSSLWKILLYILIGIVVITIILVGTIILLIKKFKQPSAEQKSEKTDKK